MPFAQGSRHATSFIAEVTYGTTPVTPSMEFLRLTGGAPNLTRENFVSEELRGDRMISDMRLGTKAVAGDVAFELSHASFDAWLESALQGAWATNILKAGVTTKSFSVERLFQDISQFGVYTGVMVNTLSLSIPPTGIVTGSMGLIGQDATFSGTALDATPTAVAATAALASAGGSLDEGGSPIAIVTGLELSLDNGLTGNYVIGSDVSQQISSGRSNLTGTLTAFFEDLTLYNKFVNETESSLSIDLVDDAANQITIDIPRLKYTGGELPIDGEGSISLNLPFQALYDVAEATNLKLTRT